MSGPILATQQALPECRTIRSELAAAHVNGLRVLRPSDSSGWPEPVDTQHSRGTIVRPAWLMPNKQDHCIQGQPTFHNRRGFLAATAAAAGLALKPAFAAGQDLASMTLKAASEMLRRKAVSPV